MYIRGTMRKILKNVYNIPKEIIIYLIASDFFILYKSGKFKKQFDKICNGCKPSYLPNWLKFNRNPKRKKACNFHDFLYKIGHPRKASDKLFLKEMNKSCTSKVDKVVNYTFYLMVRAFGKKSWSSKKMTMEEFLKIGAWK